MKIRLDENEIVAIIKEWAMMTHKSKDVSGLFKIDVTPEVTGPRGKLLQRSKINFIYVDLDVIVTEGDYTNAASSFANAALTRARQAVQDNSQSQTILPQNTPYINANTADIADYFPKFNTTKVPL